MGYTCTVSRVTSLQPIKGAMTSSKQSHGAAQPQKGLLRSTASCNSSPFMVEYPNWHLAVEDFKVRHVIILFCFVGNGKRPTFQSPLQDGNYQRTARVTNLVLFIDFPCNIFRYND